MKKRGFLFKYLNLNPKFQIFCFYGALKSVCSRPLSTDISPGMKIAKYKVWFLALNLNKVVYTKLQRRTIVPPEFRAKPLFSQ